MPFSRLLNSSYTAATAIVRSNSSNGKNLCSHGLVTGRQTSTRVKSPGRSFGSSTQVHSAFSHLSARPHSLLTRVNGTLPSSKFVKASDSSRAKSTCTHQKEFALDIERLFHGNQEFVARMQKDHPGFLVKSANEAQKPSLMILTCADSRVDEQAMFSAPLGTAFTTSNIANQFEESDAPTNAVLGFAVNALRVRHIIVLAHYGCGGVANSMMPVPSDKSFAMKSVQDWIDPVRKIYQTSDRPEIVAHREMTKMTPLTELPDIHDPAFRALVEENLKATVRKIAASKAVQEVYNSSEIDDKVNFFVHGWIYDMETGKVFDLGVSVGPPGCEVPASPFPLVAQAKGA
ncbi:hypothetical protein CVT26_005648 [Gymnopilus dilepis]|uniref:Carbonic anhydrase n=1 Tax=Gymnopilus dilepis TaxID=231916 RepID=A0A409XZT7_9AGAR|nr:hypothetical protein CVT26_005648 [Gymnopilus dilepis]